jgi:hypothetical protein
MPVYVQLVELADMNAAVHKALQTVDGNRELTYWLDLHRVLDLRQHRGLIRI